MSKRLTKYGESDSLFWIGESVLQHSFVSLLNYKFGYHVKRAALKAQKEYCTVHGVNLKGRTGTTNFFMIRSQGLYKYPVDDRARWVELSKAGVTYKDQFVAYDKYEHSGCFVNQNLAEKLKKLLEKWKGGHRVIYIQLGLWDACFTANDIEGFEREFRSVLQYVNLHAKVFVGHMTAMHNTLPQHEKRYNDTILGRVQPYNSVISKVCEELNIPLLIDTYELTSKTPSECLDGVHYSEFISRQLSIKIKRFICKSLFIDKL
ncbi:unnamed protein product [Bathycoccus prasinos]